MGCDICGKAGRLHCITCARSYLEHSRIEIAHTLIDQSAIEKHVNAILQGSKDKTVQNISLKDSKGGLLVDRHECTNNINWQRTKAEIVEIQERMQLISQQAKTLQEQIDVTRRIIKASQATTTQRQSDISSATYEIDARRANELDKTQQHVKRLHFRSERAHYDTVELRMQLCRSAAKFAGLKLTTLSSADDNLQEVYHIGPGTNLRIWDLRHLNDAPPDNLSASLAAVAQLLVRVATYLGVRLPCEITLPHYDYPQPTIFSPGSSYQGKRVPFPGSTPSHSSSNSPEASRTLDPRIHLPKPRTLFIDRQLSNLAAEDPPAYSSFIEGVSLLGYNIAWLCRIQGMKDNFKHWEDLCPVGCNLHRLLVAHETYFPQRPENPLDKDISMPKPATRRTPVGLGQLSHATSHSFLNLAENVQYLGGWNLSPIKIVDEAKSFLLLEQQAKEWDVLSQEEWKDLENVAPDDAEPVREKQHTDLATKTGRSSITTATSNGKPRSSPYRDGIKSQHEERKKGTSGWTKLKSRSDE